MCAIRGTGKTLDFALEEAASLKSPLCVLYVREQTVIAPQDRDRKWQDDPEAKRIFDYAQNKRAGVPIFSCYTVSDSIAETIVDIAATFGVSRLILGAPQRSTLIKLLRGNIIRRVADLLPENIHLVVYA